MATSNYPSLRFWLISFSLEFVIWKMLIFPQKFFMLSYLVNGWQQAVANVGKWVRLFSLLSLFPPLLYEHKCIFFSKCETNRYWFIELRKFGVREIPMLLIHPQQSIYYNKHIEFVEQTKTNLTQSFLLGKQKCLFPYQ